jgi:hypothetical protein
LEKLSLAELAENINSRLPMIDKAVFNAKEHMAAALRAATETGHYLLASKSKCGKGEWGA